MALFLQRKQSLANAPNRAFRLAPLDLLGRRYRWPETPSLDREVWTEILREAGKTTKRTIKTVNSDSW
jgi:hypothetical protein